MSVRPAGSGTAFVAGGSYVNSISLTTFTVTADSDLAIFAAFAQGQDNAETPTITWNGDALSWLNDVVANDPATNVVLQIYHRSAPAPGNNTLSASWTTACPAALGVSAFGDVHQTEPINTFDIWSTSGVSTTPSAGPIPCDSNEATLVVAAGSDVVSGALYFTTPEAYTSEYRVTTGREVPISATSALGGPSNTHTFTMSTSLDWCAVGIRIQSATTTIVPAGKIGQALIMRLRRAVSDFRTELDIRGWWRALRRRMLEA